MTVLAYTPSHVDPEILEKITVGASRKALIETLVRHVEGELGRKVHQHHLIVAPRGSGKTHTLTLVAHRLRQHPTLSGKVVPVVLREEETGGGLGLLGRILEELLELLPTLGVLPPRLRALLSAQVDALRSERDETKALQRASAALADASRALGRVIVAVIENLHNLLHTGLSVSPEGRGPYWPLRAELQRHPGLVLLAAAPTSFGEITGEGAAFYEFFRLHEMPELAPAEMVELMRERLASDLATTPDEQQRRRLGLLSENFDQVIPQIHGLVALSGGLPRFGHLLFDVLVKSELGSIRNALRSFLDEQTPYFQGWLDPRVLPRGELVVLDALACSPGPLTNRELTAKLTTTPNAVASLLKRLEARHLVRHTETPGKGKRPTVHYDANEPLFRVWRRFRVGRQEQDQLVLLATFVAQIFPLPALQAERDALALLDNHHPRLSLLDAAILQHPDFLQQLSQSVQEQLSRGSFQLAYETQFRIVEALRQQEPRDPVRLVRELFLLLPCALLSGHLSEAFNVIHEVEQFPGELKLSAIQNTHVKLFKRYALALQGKLKESLISHEDLENIFTSIEGDRSLISSLFLNGNVLRLQGRPEEALACFKKAGELCASMGDDWGRAQSLSSKGGVLKSQGKFKEALAYFEEAEALFASVGDDIEQAGAILNKGGVLESQGKFKEALAYFEEAEALFVSARGDWGRAQSLSSKGGLLKSQGKFKEALACFEEAEALFVSVGNDFWRAQALLDKGDALKLQGKLEEALTSFEEAEMLFSVVEINLGQKFAFLALRLKFFLVIEWGAQDPQGIPAELEARMFRGVTPLLEEEALRRLWLGYATALARFNPDPLPRLKNMASLLPSSHAGMLLPVQLAAEVRLGLRPASLPDQPEEMRRAVKAVLGN